MPRDRFCPDCQAKRDEAARIEQERHDRAARAWRMANLSELLRLAGVPGRYLSCSLENFRGELPEGRPAFLTGPPGVGKTHLAVAYLREELLERGRGAGRFVRAVDLFKELRATFQEDSQEKEQYVLQVYSKEIPLLVLDDLGTEKVTEWVEQVLYDLIDARSAFERPLIITSNINLDQIARHYPNHGDRLASRIAGLGEELEIKGKDRRLEGGK
jgi:DNA replication protein DnaC